VGKRRLESALESSDLRFDVRWRPFQLNEGLPTGIGLDKLEYYNERFGAQKVGQMVPQMKEVGKSVDIKFSYGGSIGNTLDSHRLIWKAREEGGSELQDKMVESLFRAYFEEEQSLGEKDVLKNCANRAGMPMDVTEALLNDSSVGEEEVKFEETKYRSKWKCQGVPLFVIDNKYTLNGAQPPEEFLAAFEGIDE